MWLSSTDGNAPSLSLCFPVHYMWWNNKSDVQAASRLCLWIHLTFPSGSKVLAYSYQSSWPPFQEERRTREAANCGGGDETERREMKGEGKRENVEREERKGKRHYVKTKTKTPCIICCHYFQLATRLFPLCCTCFLTTSPLHPSSLLSLFFPLLPHPFRLE